MVTTFKFLSRNDEAVASYGRQIPHEEADLYGRYQVDEYFRHLGNFEQLFSIDNQEEFNNLPYSEALRIVRLDNVCACYRKDILKKFPFPQIDYAEDMAWALQIMLKGFKIKYQPKIIVKHSHNRSADYHFRRAIIDSISCAKILDRTNLDLSYLNINNLKKIKVFTFKYADKLKIGSKNIPKITDNLILKESSEFIKNLYAKLFINFPYFKTGRTQYCINNHLANSLSNIKSLYGNYSNQDLNVSIDKFCSNVLGNIYGETYSSHLLKGKMTKNMENFMHHYMRDV